MSEGNPSNVAAEAQEQPKAFEQQVQEAVAAMKRTEDGKWKLPEDLPEEVKVAANLERRRRDTESALGKTRAELAEQRAIREALEQKVAASTQLSEEQRAELEELKIEDPEQWRQRVNALEDETVTSLQKELQEKATEARMQAEAERRAQVLEQFNKAHPDAPITDEALENDIPPRITNKLANGQVTFEEFLQEAYTYMTASKVIDPGASTTEVTNIGKLGGTATPSKQAIVEDFNETYQSVTF